MSYIFFDLEWNQGYPHSIEDKLDEIIQIGACRLEQWDSQLSHLGQLAVQWELAEGR